VQFDNPLQYIKLKYLAVIIDMFLRYLPENPTNILYVHMNKFIILWQFTNRVFEKSEEMYGNITTYYFPVGIALYHSLRTK
jgi:hypothetical protein